MPTLQQILDTVCNECSVSVQRVIQGRRSNATSVARGLYYLIAREYKYHPSAIASEVGRSRCACIIIINHYRGYLQVRDKTITELYNKVITKLKEL